MKQTNQEQNLNKNQQLQFIVDQVKPTFLNITITIPVAFVNTLFKQASLSQKEISQTRGFNKGAVPLEYIEQNFMSTLNEHVQEFLFNYFVLPFLYQEIRRQKIIAAGDPRLTNIHVTYNHDATFNFELSTFESIPLFEWKYFPFKAPKRKKYKDLDRQVDLFIKEEKELLKEFHDHDVVHINDWVYFTLELVDKNNKTIFDFEPLSLWLKMGDEEADEMLRSAFVGKKKGEQFYSSNRGLQHFFGDQLETMYIFRITIENVLHDTYFCFDLFKKHFKIKTNKELMQKMIEVFSYRNNLSQRRTTVEESLAILLHKHKFDVPHHVVLRQQEKVLECIAINPDYHVYKMQKDFEQRVTQLAEKQVKEELMLDMLAYNENLYPSDADIKGYLNLTKRPRAKEFIYFDIPPTKIKGKETPAWAEWLRYLCLREKTLNHVIYHLTRK